MSKKQKQHQLPSLVHVSLDNADTVIEGGPDNLGVPHSFAFFVFFANKWVTRISLVSKLLDGRRFDLHWPLLKCYAHLPPRTGITSGDPNCPGGAPLLAFSASGRCVCIVPFFGGFSALDNESPDCDPGP